MEPKKTLNFSFAKKRWQTIRWKLWQTVRFFKIIDSATNNNKENIFITDNFLGIFTNSPIGHPHLKGHDAPQSFKIQLLDVVSDSQYSFPFYSDSPRLYVYHFMTTWSTSSTHSHVRKSLINFYHIESQRSANQLISHLAYGNKRIKEKEYGEKLGVKVELICSW